MDKILSTDKLVVNFSNTNKIEKELYKIFSVESYTFLGYDLSKPVPNKLIIETGIGFVS